MKDNNIRCFHKEHYCKVNNFIYVNDDKKFIFLEVPKNACSYMKKNLPNIKNLKKDELIKNYDKKYKDYFIFGIYRNFEERIISNYKNFILQKIPCRLNQMSLLFKLNINEIENLNFKNFLKLALKYRDHHWESQIKFLNIHEKIKVNLFHINNLENIFKILNLEYINEKINSSVNIKINIDQECSELIKNIYKEDFNNINFFKNIK
jgi:hypothetical protein